MGLCESSDDSGNSRRQSQVSLQERHSFKPGHPINCVKKRVSINPNKSKNSALQQAIKFYNSGQYQDSLNILKQELTKIKQGAENSYHVYAIFVHIGLTLMKLYKFEKALYYFERALNLVSQDPGENSHEYADCLNCVAIIYTE
mmetsp:Transcript_29381/g.26834  ORF Transcript_29381/g.26834 Transcript_29381/m.26834 type:complete len:144 (-) Transcript_29381:420-851(-)